MSDLLAQHALNVLDTFKVQYPDPKSQVRKTIDTAYMAISAPRISDTLLYRLMSDVHAAINASKGV
jgi:hypothetical protein